VRDEVSSYLAHLRAKGVTPHTADSVALALSHLLDHVGDRDVRQIDERDVVSFLRRLGDRPSERTGRVLATSTQATYFSAVRGLFHFLEGRGVILRDPARGVPLPKARRLPRALGEREARRLVSAPETWTTKGQRDQALLELLYGTGLRLAECVRLDLQDLDLDAGRLLVRDGKGRKDRYVPVSGQATKALLAYLRETRPLLERPYRADEGALFLSRHGTRLGGRSVRILVRRYGAAVGVAASTHVLRHSYATHLLQGGANVREIQLLLGHEGLTTTALYTRVDTRALAAMIRRHHPRELRR
jgi:site-specific recombinase XerD